MLMTFSKERYMERILSGVKIHTVRADPHNRWKKGMTAQMWMHSPRNVSKNPFQFAVAPIIDVLPIKISKNDEQVLLFYPGWQMSGPMPVNAEEFARCDGFDTAEDMFEWFGQFTGKIIYWGKVEPVKKLTAAAAG